MSQQQFPEWLQSLGPIRADLPPGDRQWPVSHEVTFNGDVTSWGLAGTIKASPNTTTELAVWTVGTPVFTAGRTVFPVSLTGVQTRDLPRTLTDDRGVDYDYYDFIASGPFGVAPFRCAAGLFTVRGFITEP